MKMQPQIKLTQTVQKGGCAAKVAAAELREILKSVSFPKSPPELLVGTDTFDDAAIYQLTPDLAMVQTLDFFTPIVDSPKWFGRIAAANALSDVYAMGGTPVTAMSILAFPLVTLDSWVITEVLQGAVEVIQKSGASLVGGHTIDDDTLKFGLSVTGTIHPKNIWSNAKARIGDQLILTKPLGTGTLTSALKNQAIDEQGILDALESMCQLNNIKPLLTQDVLSSIHAATDVTGFGLAGHLYNMTLASQVSAKINCASLPKFKDALHWIEEDYLTKAHRTNAEYVSNFVQFNPSVPPSLKQLVFDPQTSGGLLLSVASHQAQEILTQLKREFVFANIIGEVIEEQASTKIYFNES